MTNEIAKKEEFKSWKRHIIELLSNRYYLINVTWDILNPMNCAKLLFSMFFVLTNRCLCRFAGGCCLCETMGALLSIVLINFR